MAKKRTPFDHAAAEARMEFMASLEGDLSQVSGAGRTQEEREMLAEELLTAAEDADNPIEMIPLLLRAVRVDPTCLHARHLLARITGGPASELAEELQLLTALGEKLLGPKYFRENRGHFWMLIETRPYMRIRAHLAATQHTAGNPDAAIAHYEELLSLCPGDNMGLRYRLAPLYLETGKLPEAEKLLSEYDEKSAVWCWTKVLLSYLQLDLPAAENHLATARKQNRFVEAYITSLKKLPKESPGFYSPGSLEEAAICMESIGPVWSRYPEAAQWLKKQSPEPVAGASKGQATSKSKKPAK